ncbi:transposase [Bradyrhizobium jicamae]|uniref:transposase n=1 Tax=Bradyrhizobium jicamae TaxID=280332 RepID=UPI001FD94913|nr:transposase [Bradyrhizobium jicamae]
MALGAVVSDVARRHGLTPQQVFTWRRQARQVPPVTVDELSLYLLWSTHRPRPSPRSTRHADPRPNQVAGVSRLRSMALPSGPAVARGRGHDCCHRSCAEGAPVISPSRAVRVKVATKSVDFRKGMEGLAALVRESMRAAPHLCVGRDYVAEAP